MRATDDPVARVRLAYATAYGRPPTGTELTAALAFVISDAESSTSWADFCHVMINTKEFVSIR
jgi:hypothetical protein